MFIISIYFVFACSFWLDVVDQRVVATGDAWPTVTKLVKGQYGVTLHVRATSVDMLQVWSPQMCGAAIRAHETPFLQNITTLQMLLERDLSKAIPLSFYATQTGAMSGTAKAGTVNLKPGEALRTNDGLSTLNSEVHYVRDQHGVLREGPAGRSGAQERFPRRLADRKRHILEKIEWPRGGWGKVCYEAVAC